MVKSMKDPNNHQDYEDSYTRAIIALLLLVGITIFLLVIASIFN